MINIQVEIISGYSATKPQNFKVIFYFLLIFLMNNIMDSYCIGLAWPIKKIYKYFQQKYRKLMQ